MVVENMLYQKDCSNGMASIPLHLFSLVCLETTLTGSAETPACSFILFSTLGEGLVIRVYSTMPEKHLQDLYACKKDSHDCAMEGCHS